MRVFSRRMIPGRRRALRVNQHLHRTFLAGAIVTLGCLVVGASSVSAAKPSRHCVVQLPTGPLDLNEFYGVNAQIVIPDCNQIVSGRPWTVGARWFMNTTFSTVPDGFVPAGDTPLEDFLAKFSALKYVVDPGTSEQKTYVIPNGPALWVGLSPTGFPFVNTLTLTTLRPLSVGQHVVEVYWSFNAMHCDGLGDVIDFPNGNCPTAGEHFYYAVPFTVTADHQ